MTSLIGMPGCGKSAIGKALAHRLGTRFVDCDRVIEERAGYSIASLFARDGEPAFRELEAEVLESIVAEGNCIVATGGGAVLRADNREALRTRTTCVYLDVPVDTLWKRLRRDRRRPLLQVRDAEARLHELRSVREPLYRETAAIVVDTRGLSFDAVVDTIIERLRLANAAP